MFNRKISSESFDDSLEEFEDFLHDPLLTRDISNKSTSNDTSAVDLETGEILSPQPRETTRNTRSRSAPTPPENSRTTQAKVKGIVTTPFLFLLPIGFSLFFCLITCLVGYIIFTNELTELSLQAEVTSEKVTNLDNLVKELQITHSSSEESEEVLSQLEDLSIGLEDVEAALQKHTQTTKHAFPLPAIKKTSPIDSLKNVAYLGFYGTSTQPIAIIRIKDQQKELLTGQSVTELWQLTSIHPNHILVTHADGLTQQIARKKSLF
jgi:hypothetical protein